MQLNLITFQDWYQNITEGGAMRRLKRDAFIRGTMPPISPARVHSGGTGSPCEVKAASKVKTDEDVRRSKKKKKKGN